MTEHCFPSTESEYGEAKPGEAIVPADGGIRLSGEGSGRVAREKRC